MVGRRLILTLVLATLPTVTAAAKPADEANPLVTARLIAATTAVVPGQSFLLGVELTMAEGWHVYWKNPGEAGLATAIDWRLPEGFEAGPLRWPVPIRFTMPGRITAFGYAGEVVLIAFIRVPRDLGDRRQVTLSANVSWLGCNGTCVPGEADVHVTLPVGEGTDSPQADRVRASWTHVPERLPSHQAAAAVTRPDGRTVDAEDAQRQLLGHRTGVAYETLEGPYAVHVRWMTHVSHVEWFPDPGPALAVSDVEVRTDAEKRQTAITFTVRVLKGQKLDRGTMETVVAYTDAKGRRRGVLVNVPLMAAKHEKPTPAVP